MKLNDQKNDFLQQAKSENCESWSMKEFQDQFDTWEDLKVEDFKDILSSSKYEELANCFDRDTKFWNSVMLSLNSKRRETMQDIEEVLHNVSEYERDYPNGKFIKEANDLHGKLNKEKTELSDWLNLKSTLDVANITKYLVAYPDSTHKSELDDIAYEQLSPLDYIELFPSGNHIQKAKGEIGKEERERIRAEELDKMRQNPMQYPVDKVLQYINDGMFDQEELIKEELIFLRPGEQKWNPYIEGLKDLQQYLTEGELTAPDGCTDVYLFGVPGSGKTCLLQGLLNEKDHFSFETLIYGGNYGLELQHYTKKGKPAIPTTGNYASIINGHISALHKKRIISHDVNLIEMAGEAYRDRIVDLARKNKGQSADDKEKNLSQMKLTFGDMALNIRQLLGNSNPKVFFLVIDATGDRKIHNGEEYYQTDVLNGFIEIFKYEEKVMRNVKAIHIVVTKADMLRGGGNSLDKAYEHVKEYYNESVKKLLTYLGNHTWINKSTNNIPHLFAFSLGKFYLGNLFKYDKKDSRNIINVIQCTTKPRRQETWWDKVADFLG